MAEDGNTLDLAADLAASEVVETGTSGSGDLCGGWR